MAAAAATLAAAATAAARAEEGWAAGWTATEATRGGRGTAAEREHSVAERLGSAGLPAAPGLAEVWAAGTGDSRVWCLR